MSPTETPQERKPSRFSEKARNLRFFLKNLVSRNNIATISFLAGVASASYGASLYAAAAGWLVCGVGLIIFGYLLGQE